MLRILRSSDRGRTELGWLSSRHSFSFGDYLNPAWMGFRALRVLNEDVVAPGGGFPTHPHRDMEIVTYVLSGALEHRDSMGHHSVLRAGSIQRMTAGTGVTHSEFNASDQDPVHFLQIWIVPDRTGHPPSYEERSVPADAGAGPRLIASPDGRDGSMEIHRDVSLYAARLTAGSGTELVLGAERRSWVQVASGSVSIHGERLEGGDGAAVEGEPVLSLQAATEAELLVFDLP